MFKLFPYLSRHVQRNKHDQNVYVSGLCDCSGQAGSANMLKGRTQRPELYITECHQAWCLGAVPQLQLPDSSIADDMCDLITCVQGQPRVVQRAFMAWNMEAHANSRQADSTIVSCVPLASMCVPQSQCCRCCKQAGSSWFYAGCIVYLYTPCVIYSSCSRHLCGGM